MKKYRNTYCDKCGRNKTIKDLNKVINTIEKYRHSYEKSLIYALMYRSNVILEDIVTNERYYKTEVLILKDKLGLNKGKVYPMPLKVFDGIVSKLEIKKLPSYELAILISPIYYHYYHFMKLAYEELPLETILKIIWKSICSY